MPNRRYFSITGFSYTILLAISFGLSYLLSLLLSAFPALNDSPALILLLSTCPVYLIGGCGAYALFRRVEGKQICYHRISVGWLIKCFIVSSFLGDAGNLIGQGVNAAMEHSLNFQIKESVSGMITQMNVGMVILLAVIIGPVFEELLFRKMVIDRLIVFGDKAAILVSAMIFGVIHGNFSQFFYTFFIGLVLGYVYIRSGRIQNTILLHMLFNFWGAVIPLILERKVFSVVSGSDLQIMPGVGAIILMVFYVIAVIVFLIAGLIMFIKAFRKLDLLQGERSMPAGPMAAAIFGNPGMILFLACSVLTFWLNGS